MSPILISACLLGKPTRYDGKYIRYFDAGQIEWLRRRRAVSFCPEIAGGLPTPRPPAEICGGAGAQVLDGVACIRTRTGANVSKAFLQGAESALAMARQHNTRVAILKDGSPSCGTTYIYDGSFSGSRIQGSGVTAELLTRNGIRVFPETDFETVRALPDLISR